MGGLPGLPVGIEGHPPRIGASYSCGVALVIGLLFVAMYYLPHTCFLRVWVYRVAFKVRAYAIVPKLKVLLALYQMVVYIPEVYEVPLPPE